MDVNQKNNIEPEQVKPFIEHLNEFKKRLLFVLGIFLISFCFSYFAVPYFINLIKASAVSYNIQLNIFKITESVSIYIKIMFFLAIGVSLPSLIIQLYIFTKPALSKKVKNICKVLVPIISILFIIGTFLGFIYLVPTLLHFFINTSKVIGVNTIFNFSDFFNFVFTICLLIGLILEMPVIIVFLNIINIVSLEFLKSSRKFAYPLMTLLGTVLTPPDFTSDIIVSLLMFFLYEASISLCKIIHLKSISIQKIT